MDAIRIFDTTLRDGEQSPGATLTRAEKLEIARHLEAMGVDVIEAGFPISSDGDFESVRAIAAEVTRSVVCGLARCTPRDIERAGAAVKDAAKPRIHLFLATSKIHREHKLRKGKGDIVKLAVESVRMAKAMCGDVEFSPEDASRTELEFLEEVTAAAVEAGATTVNLPDTVGYATPAAYGAIFSHLLAKLPILRERGVVLSSHCHNDLGLAVANSLAAVENGARQVECTINGIGERAGNAALEEVVMALRTRADHYRLRTNVDTTKIYPASRLVSTLTGLTVQRNKAIVGENAFAHESGIHQDGMLKHRETYEIMDPATVGLAKTNLVLGKHSGRAAFRDRVVPARVHADRRAGRTGLHPVQDPGRQEEGGLRRGRGSPGRRPVGDRDRPVAAGGMPGRLRVEHGFRRQTVTLIDTAGQMVMDAGTGDGPVDAIYAAIGRLTGIAAEVTDYRIRAVSRGHDAQGEVTVEIRHDGRTLRGRGLSTDILQASALAYLAALNRVRSMADRVRQVTQFSTVWTWHGRPARWACTHAGRRYSADVSKSGAPPHHRGPTRRRTVGRRGYTPTGRDARATVAESGRRSYRQPHHLYRRDGQ